MESARRTICAYDALDRRFAVLLLCLSVTAQGPTTGGAVNPEAQDAPAGAFAIDVSKPVRITWPLDVGPDADNDRTDNHLCLRARQGVNELQTPGAGKALYGFRIRREGDYKTYFRVRWIDDGVGSVECNNSWFAGIDNRPAAVIGNKGKSSIWHWEAGPTVRMARGVHWLRVELREDGVRMDRAVVAPADKRCDEATLDTTAAFDFAGFAGERPPFQQQRPVRVVEFCAYPTASLAIGRGHVNEVTVCASYQGSANQVFEGTVDIHCPIAHESLVRGDRRIGCGPGRPFARRVLTLVFPSNALRRAHRAIVTVRNADQSIVSHEEIRFTKGHAWAFLGPFRDSTGRPRHAHRYSGSLDRLMHPCDSDLRQVATLQRVGNLGLAGIPLAQKDANRQWRIISDGSCYDWTGAVDLGRVYGTTGRAFAYAVTWIEAETRLQHRSFTFQTDDAGWL